MSKGREHEGRYETEAIRAQELVKAGQLNEAYRLLNGLPQGAGMTGWLQEKVIALVSLAEGFLVQGELEHAVETLFRAETECTALREGATWEEADSLAGIGRLWIQVGRKREAVMALETAAHLAQRRERVDPDCRKILRDIAGFLAVAGEREKAFEVAQLIRHDKVLKEEALRRAKGNTR